MATTPSIPSGAVTLFRQVAAPVGWTKKTTYDNYALRVTSGAVGTGGNSAITFTTLNSINIPVSGSYKITSATVAAAAGSIAPHDHGVQQPFFSTVPATADSSYVVNPAPLAPKAFFTGDHTASHPGGVSPKYTANPIGTTYRGLGPITTNLDSPSSAAGGNATHTHTATFENAAVGPNSFASYGGGPFGVGGSWGFSLVYIDVILCTRN
jgi:hypothetical protein